MQEFQLAKSDIQYLRNGARVVPFSSNSNSLSALSPSPTNKTSRLAGGSTALT